MKARLQQLGIEDVRLIEGGRGVFDIRLDGRLAYSKHGTGRFPSEADINALLA